MDTTEGSEHFDVENMESAPNVSENAENEEESDEDDMTAAEVLQALENAWLNEKFAPELLPHHIELVDCMLGQISHMEDNLKRLDKGDIRVNIHTMEISRIRFIISSYLWKWLDKIEEYAIQLLFEETNQTSKEAYMTPAEARFAREYVASVESLFQSLALQLMPGRLKEFDLPALAPKPNMRKHVFVKANKSVSGVLIPGTIDEDIDLDEGSQHIIQYDAVEHLVKTGGVQLIE